MSIRTIFANAVVSARGTRPQGLLALCGFVLALALCVPGAVGQTLVSFPTEGRFRPGRYMPVRVQRDAGAGTLTLEARGMVPTSLATNGAPDVVVVPWLAVSDSVTDARWTAADGGHHSIGTPLHALADDERLVAYAGTPPGDGKVLFPGKTIAPVELDLSRPLLEPPEAWECLDAIVLSGAAFTRLDDSQLTTLLAGGTAIAVRSHARPVGKWPWEQIGDDWVLRFDPAGPASIIEPAAYSPTYEWERGWPATFRRRVFLAAVLFCLIGGAVLLWRSRWAAVAFIALSCLFVAAFAGWYARQSPMLQLAAVMRIDNAPVTQFDLWTWHSPVRAMDGSFPAAGATWPVFASGRQPEQTHTRLQCAPDGRPDRFLFHLDPGQSLAFLSRNLRIDSPAPPALVPARGPFVDLATTLYLRPGDLLAGQYTARESVSVIVLRQGSK
jgi:hypothetical protein